VAIRVEMATKKKKKKGKGKGQFGDMSNNVFSLKIVDLSNVTSSASGKYISVSLYAAQSETTKWMNDTGCTLHITHDINDFIHYHEFITPGCAKTAGKSQYIEIKEYGTVVLQVNVDGKIWQLVLTNVLYVSQASARFIASHEPLQKGHVIIIDEKCLTLRANQIDGPILYKAFFDAQDYLYWLNATIMHNPTQVNKEPNGYQWLMANGSSASTSNYDL
jgi:hypothetical protein